MLHHPSTRLVLDETSFAFPTLLLVYICNFESEYRYRDYFTDLHRFPNSNNTLVTMNLCRLRFYPTMCTHISQMAPCPILV